MRTVRLVDSRRYAMSRVSSSSGKTASGSVIQVFAIVALILAVWVPTVIASDFSFGKKVIVKYGQTVDDAVSFGEDVYVFGTVSGDAVAIGGSVIVDRDGSVKGDAVAIGDDIQVRSGGNISGDAVSIGGGMIIDDGGVVGGDKVNLLSCDLLGRGLKNTLMKILIFGPIIGIFGFIGIIIGLIIAVLKLVFMLAVAVLIAYFFPNNVSLMADHTGREFWKSLLFGILAIVVIPVLALVLLVSIIGIPFIPIFLLFLLAAYLYGATGVSLWVGRFIHGAENRSVMVNVIVGVLVLAVIRFIPILGFLVKVGIMAVAFGMLIFTRFGTRSTTSAE